MRPSVNPLPVHATSHTTALPDPVEDRHNTTLRKRHHPRSPAMPSRGRSVVSPPMRGCAEHSRGSLAFHPASRTNWKTRAAKRSAPARCAIWPRVDQFSILSVAGLEGIPLTAAEWMRPAAVQESSRPCGWRKAGSGKATRRTAPLPSAAQRQGSASRHSGLLDDSPRTVVWPDSVQVSGGFALNWAAHPRAGVAHYRSAVRWAPLTRRGSRGDCPARSSTAHLAVPINTSSRWELAHAADGARRHRG